MQFTLGKHGSSHGSLERSHKRPKVSPSHLQLVTSREELPSLLVSLYKHCSSLLQKQATVLGWSTHDKLVLTSLARISRVHASGDVGVHCKLPFSKSLKPLHFLERLSVASLELLVISVVTVCPL